MKNIVRTVVLGFLAVFIVIAVAPPFRSQTVTGSIEGTVTRTDRSEAISGVEIFLAGGTNPGITAIEAQDVLNQNAAYGVAMPEDLRQIALNGSPNFYTTNGPARGLRPVAVTDGAGHFSIGNLASGTYTVRAQRSGYFGPISNGIAATNVSVTIAVVPQQAQSVSLSLGAAASVSGRVTNPQGTAAGLMGIDLWTTVEAIGVRSIRAYDPGSFDGGYSTNAYGEYRIDGLPPGEYYVEANPARAGGSVITCLDCPTIRPPAGSVMNVRTFYPSTIDPTAAMPIVLHTGDNVTGLDIRLRTGPIRKISGNVINSLPHIPELSIAGSYSLTDLLQGIQVQLPQAADAARATLELVPRDPAQPLLNLLNYNFALFADGGRFELAGAIPPGTYDLYAVIQDYPGFGVPDPHVQGFSYGRTSLIVGNEDLNGIAVNVHRGVDLKGRVTLDGSAPSRTDLQIALDPVETPRTGNFGGRYSIGSDGSFSIPFMPEGRYRIHVVPSGPSPRSRSRFPPIPNTYVADIRQGNVSIYDDGIHIGTSIPEPIEISLQTNGGGIDGVITDNGGKRVYGPTVVLVPAPQHRRNFELFVQTVSDFAGHFAMSNVVPGDYKLFAWEDNTARLYETPEFFTAHEDFGKPVAVTPGTRQTVNASLITK